MNLQFDTGYITLSINGDETRTISFNPTDPLVVNRFLAVGESLERKGKELEALEMETNKGINEETDLFERAKITNRLRCEIDQFVRDQVNSVFGDGADKSIFADVSPTAVTKNGMTVFENFISAVLPVFESEIRKRDDETNKIIAKYKKRG